MIFTILIPPEIIKTIFHFSRWFPSQSPTEPARTQDDKLPQVFTGVGSETGDIEVLVARATLKSLAATDS